MEPNAKNAQTQGFMLRSGFELQQKPLTGLLEFETPLDALFGVTHMGVCQLERSSWYMDVKGLVQHPLRLCWDDLARFPRRRLMATHECAGNPLLPKEPVRRIGNIVWEGVALRDVLEEVGVLPEARYMWSHGADVGVFNQVTHVNYQKDLTVETAFNAQILLATHLNGELLTTERGAPVRLVVPDFYGTNSTKWLVSLEFQAERAPGYFATTLYNEEVDGEMRPVWALAPHSIFVSHQANQVINAGQHTIWGWAWGAGGIAEVEVSTDGGQTWQICQLQPRIDHAWQKFTLDWQASVGPAELICRARGNNGQQQPATSARNAWYRVAVQVQA